jgi:hypothetical protein
MSAIPLRFVPILVGGLLAMAALPASAQTTINLHTASGNCVAVTNDSAGVTSDPSGGSTALQANDVTLTENPVGSGACIPAGGSSSEFDVQVSVVPTGTVAIGVPFNVTWSASGDATSCVRTGSANVATGTTGWVLGSTVACSGAGCGGTQAVTPTAAGSYSFGMTCSNASGIASATAPTVPNPTVPAPTPNPVPLVVPAGANSAVPFAVTWPQMQNAARCVGTGTLAGVAAPSLGDWTTVQTVSNSAANSRNVTVPAGQTGALVLKLTCWNSDDSASAVGTSTSIAVTASTGACPTTINTTDGSRTLLTQSDIFYGPQSGVRMGVQLNEWNNVWGYNGPAPQPVAWPGVTGSAPRINAFKRDSYVGYHFKTPLAPLPGLASTFTNPTWNPSPALTMAISTACGDFSAHLPTPGCLKQNMPSNDQPMVYWQFATTSPTLACNLLPNTDYYVNIMLYDKTSTVECAASSNVCPIVATNGH